MIPRARVPRLTIAAATLLLLGAACAGAPAAPPALAPLAAGQPPDHLMLLVFDQMRPDYVDRFDLPNFKRLRRDSVNHENAFLGFMGSETVVGHFVIPTGLLPRALPWNDEFVFDPDGSLLGTPGKFIEIAELPWQEQHRLMERVPPEQTLQGLLERRFPGRRVLAAGQKDYAAAIFGGPYAHAFVTLVKKDGVCRPAGKNLPAYIAGDQRFTIDCSNAFGSASAPFPIDGRTGPGDGPRFGGDVWTADVVLRMMERERWSGLFVTFGAIDKIGHLLGEPDGPSLSQLDTPYHLEAICRIADAQLGRLLDKLESTGLAGRTLVVVTSDHGGQSNRVYLGPPADAGRPAAPGDRGWAATYSLPEDVAFTYEDSAVRVWLKHRSADARARVVAALSKVPGMVSIYELRDGGGGWSYRRVAMPDAGAPGAAGEWLRAHEQEIVDTAATATSPDLIGLLAEGHGFDAFGDHGGAQESVQRVPMFIRAPGLTPREATEPMRMTELFGTIRELMRL